MMNPVNENKSAHTGQPAFHHGAVNAIVTEAQVREVLKLVEDPELHIDIITLELVYGVAIENGSVLITMTLTTPACPYGPMLVEFVKAAVKKVPGVEHVEVKVTFEPLWQPSDDLKAMMGLL
jgi:metal-sulfur cluster biosynthetic enzyme